MMQKAIQKYTCLLLLLLFLSAPALHAQETEKVVPLKEEPEKILKKLNISRVTKSGIKLWQDDFSGHFAGIDFGFNLFVNENYAGYDREFMANSIARSNSVHFNIAQQSIGLQKERNKIGLLTGLALDIHSYRLEDNTSIIRDENSVIQPQFLYFDDNQKSKLSVLSITIPLLTEFQVPIDHVQNRMYISGGFFGRFRINSHTKIKYKKQRKERLKKKDHYSLHDFRYGIMVRAGYRWFNVFATYDLVPLFKDNKGPDLTPVTFGITLLSF